MREEKQIWRTKSINDTCIVFTHEDDWLEIVLKSGAEMLKINMSRDKSETLANKLINCLAKWEELDNEYSDGISGFDFDMEFCKIDNLLSMDISDDDSCSLKVCLSRDNISGIVCFIVMFLSQ